MDEVVIQPGHPVSFHGEQGALVLGDDLDESMISDALSVVLAPEQQAELAVAGVVAFHVEGHAEWSMVAENAVDGVIIRGRMRDGAPERVGMPLDLPPLRRFDPEHGMDIPHSAESALQHNPSTRATRWDMGVAGAVLDEMPSGGSLEDPTLPANRPTHRLSAIEEPRPQPAQPLEDAAIDFALVGRHPVTAQLPGIDPGDSGTMPRSVSGTRPTMRGDDTLALHVDALESGTIAYLAGTGVGERLLQHLDEGYEVIDIHTWDEVTSRPFEEMPAGRGYLVRLEDPSRCLAWLLRRLEEGARIVVETRARTASGARRMLLGVEATPHVVMWLDAHPQLWLHADGRTWMLERM